MQRGTNTKKKVPSWEVVGALLALYRKQAGLTQPQLATHLCVGLETLGSIEQGRRALRLSLAREIDDLLETKGALTVAVSKAPKKERFPAFVQDFIELEAQALNLCSYENGVVPGLLQSAEYARAVFDSLYPPITSQEAEDRMLDRLDRQRIFEQKPWPPMMSFLLDESVLERAIGGPEVLRGQILHLRQMAELPFLAIQIIPKSRTKHAGLDGPMVLIETPDHEHVAYIEGQRVSCLIDDPDEVGILQAKYGMLRSQALTPEETMGLLDRLAGET
ncbi:MULTISPECIES: helix-turn-helix domain-containing protein [unclassified Streptomyces]|uniref:helix-turn-helix domain-containing protein n=1 Tax=unclassified Streptomyces TaxID=2593676 RepID=UPI00166141A4|nr:MULTISPECIES: helix-turn-helix transcriptional regulator [unclassified Streptomyces]MBD0710596.1 transcriptional regulator [Streptomyces sp. CBMA291]MBD0715443.1 transcriptional regulator [Streptomyces sp. CBMA370]